MLKLGALPVLHLWIMYNIALSPPSLFKGDPSKSPSLQALLQLGACYSGSKITTEQMLHVAAL